MSKFKILIADDHAMIRNGIKTMLKENKNYVVAGEALDGQEAVEKFKTLAPDLTILDISMPVLNGMEAAREILQEKSDAKIVILSMYDDEEYINRCMEVGVMGYVIKNESVNELEYAVNAALQGKVYYSTQVQQSLFKKYANTKGKKQEPELKLTNREIEIIKLIAEGLTSQQMASKLFISPRTVETHRANLMKKTGVKNVVELVRKAQELRLI